MRLVQKYLYAMQKEAGIKHVVLPGLIGAGVGAAEGGLRKVMGKQDNMSIGQRAALYGGVGSLGGLGLRRLMGKSRAKSFAQGVGSKPMTGQQTLRYDALKRSDKRRNILAGLGGVGLAAGVAPILADPRRTR